MIRVGTANVKDTLDDDQASHALDLFLANGLDLGGLEEWSKARDHLIRGRSVKSARGKAGGGPVLYNPDRFILSRVKTKALVDGGFMGRIAGRRSKLGPSYATLATLRDKAGKRYVVIVIHLTAEVQVGQGYRSDRTHEPRVQRHIAERKAIQRLVRRYRRRDVYVVGDTNYDGMPLPPLVSCWERRPGGTLGSRAVDYVYSNRRPIDVHTIKTPSDHRAVICTYKETA